MGINRAIDTRNHFERTETLGKFHRIEVNIGLLRPKAPRDIQSREAERPKWEIEEMPGTERADSNEKHF
jgi:hypothetical protein